MITLVGSLGKGGSLHFTTSTISGSKTGSLIAEVDLGLCKLLSMRFYAVIHRVKWPTTFLDSWTSSSDCPY